MFGIFKKKTTPSNTSKMIYSGDIDLVEGVTVLGIVKNGEVVYLNLTKEGMFKPDSDGEMRLDGRSAVIRVYDDVDNIQCIVGFVDNWSYYWASEPHRFKQFEDAAKLIFKFTQDHKIELFSPTKVYQTEYNWEFKTYRNEKQLYFMNSGMSESMILDQKSLQIGDQDLVLNAFWRVTPV